jgi:hypothetical protein
MIEATTTVMPRYRVPLRVTVFQWLKEQGHTMEDIADRTGYKADYLRNVKSATRPLPDAFKWRLAVAYPDIRPILFDEEAAASE